MDKRKPVGQTTLLNRLLGRMIRESLGRFIAITLIIMLGVMIFVGVKGIGPGYRDSAAVDLQSTRLHDIEVTSTGGLTDKDLSRVREVAGVTATPVRSSFNLADTDEAVVQVYAGTGKTGMDRLLVREGRLPRAADEIVLDQRAKEYGQYKVGQAYLFEAKRDLKRRTFRIVGFVDSPRFINNTYNRGMANIGSGTVAYFAYVPAKAFGDIPYSSITLRLTKRPAGDSFTQSYQRAVDKKVKAVRKALKGRATARAAELVRTASAPLRTEQAKLNAAKQQLAGAKAQVAAASGGQLTTTPEITAQEAQLTAAQAKLDKARDQIAAKVDVQYAYNDRGDLQGFTDFGDSADRIAAIGDVFPVFFFLIAALITFTTVSRMIAEDRTQLGTMKALGFTRSAIARNYFLYALLAAVIGTIAGILTGLQGLTRFVLAISQTNIFAHQVIIPQWADLAIATGMALAATIGAVLIVAPSELHVKPATLMLPKAPKDGKTILVERIRPLWRRLSFHQKVTMRNLFRFKSRMLMTIIGIAGGAGLILTGFGIRDSIVGTSNAQFGPQGVAHYQAVVRLNEAGSPAPARKLLAESDKLTGSTRVIYDVSKVARGSHNVTGVSLIAPLKASDLADDVDLGRRDHPEQRSLPKRGVLLSMKAADILGATKGDKVRITNAAGVRKTATVSGVVRNYAGHYAYMRASEYQRLWGKTADNTLLVSTKAMTAKQQRHLAQRLLAKNAAVNVSYTSDSLALIEHMSQSMNAVVMILIVLSGMLSFVVLYNLTNINVSERMRELSTIKVLGFFDGEVTMYIMRENLILTVIGILCSFGVGQILTAYILNQAASEAVVFPFIIHWYGYVAAAVLTLAFTGIVMAVTHRRLKRVDMLKALAARE